MLDWILRHLGVVIFLAILVSQILKALLGSRKAAQTHPSAEAQRVREIQEQIRRQIVERRAGRTMPAPPAQRGQETPPVARPQTTQLPELFGGPLGRMIEELQKRAQPPPPAPTPPPVLAHQRHAAELERQQQLADQLNALRETKAATHRRAAQDAAEQQRVAQSETALRAGARDRLLLDLGDAQSLRRAFVLREVLGAPVGLR